MKWSRSTKYAKVEERTRLDASRGPASKLICICATISRGRTRLLQLSPVSGAPEPEICTPRVQSTSNHGRLEQAFAKVRQVHRTQTENTCRFFHVSFFFFFILFFLKIIFVWYHRTEEERGFMNMPPNAILESNPNGTAVREGTFTPSTHPCRI